MGSAQVGFPSDWLQHGAGPPATDVDLAVLLVNSHDLLDDPPDRLHDLTWFREVLRIVGHAELAGELSDRDLPALRRLRDGLRTVFEARDGDAAAAILNPMLTRSRAVPLLVPEPSGRAALAVAPDRTGVDALRARLPAALATLLASDGLERLGTCAGHPCACAFVDRTRGRTRRFCCSVCNDRAAARNYRARRRNDHVN